MNWVLKRSKFQWISSSIRNFCHQSRLDSNLLEHFRLRRKAVCFCWASQKKLSMIKKICFQLNRLQFRRSFIEKKSSLLQTSMMCNTILISIIKKFISKMWELNIRLVDGVRENPKENINKKCENRFYVSSSSRLVLIFIIIRRYISLTYDVILVDFE